jgi:dephospho-CoA kinase
MLLIGLTGSIATGKSTVSKLLSAPPHSLPIIDADVLAREVVAPGTPGYRKIITYFGPTTPDLLVPPGPDMPDSGPDGNGRPLNRPALGRRVFGDDASRRKDRAVLNSIVHPAIRRLLYRRVLSAYLRGERAVVLDVPLLFEAGLDLLCGLVVVVGVRDPAVQMARLRARDAHLSEEDAAARVGSQGAVGEKARRAEARGEGRGAVVWNDGTKEELEIQVGRVMARVAEGSPRWWAWLLLGCPPLAVCSAAWEVWRNWRANARWKANEAAKAKL